MSHTAVPLPTDDALVDELRRLAAFADPLPAAWRAAATASYGWHRIEAEPAALARCLAGPPGVGSSGLCPEAFSAADVVPFGG